MQDPTAHALTSLVMLTAADIAAWPANQLYICHAIAEAYHTQCTAVQVNVHTCVLKLCGLAGQRSRPSHPVNCEVQQQGQVRVCE